MNLTPVSRSDYRTGRGERAPRAAAQPATACALGIFQKQSEAKETTGGNKEVCGLAGMLGAE
jgi:hypothetical protein